MRPSRFFAGVAVLMLVGIAFGQEQPLTAEPDSAEPEVAAELPDAIRALLLGIGDASTVSSEPLLAVEGSVLPERPGLVRRTPYGEWVFVFMDDSGRPRAMVLLPCRQLERMVESVESIGATAVRLTGTLTVYGRVNYLLPTAFSVIAAPRASTTSESETDSEAISPDAMSEIDPALREVAEALEAGRERARAIQAPTVAPPGVRPESAGEKALAEDDRSWQEGDRVLRRRARLERQRGLWTLRFDQSPDAPISDLPVLVLPNAMLRSMEQALGRYGDRVAFEVSGTIYRYGPQPYVLVTMQFVQPLEGLRPGG